MKFLNPRKTLQLFENSIHIRSGVWIDVSAHFSQENHELTELEAIFVEWSASIHYVFNNRHQRFVKVHHAIVKQACIYVE